MYNFEFMAYRLQVGSTHDSRQNWGMEDVTQQSARTVEMLTGGDCTLLPQQSDFDKNVWDTLRWCRDTKHFNFVFKQMICGGFIFFTDIYYAKEITMIKIQIQAKQWGKYERFLKIQ